MKTVTIDGVVLTEKQVKAALAKLEAELPTIDSGTMVTWPNEHGMKRFFVVGKAVATWADLAFGKPMAHQTRITDGCHTWSAPTSELYIVITQP